MKIIPLWLKTVFSRAAKDRLQIETAPRPWPLSASIPPLFLGNIETGEGVKPLFGKNFRHYFLAYALPLDQLKGESEIAYKYALAAKDAPSRFAISFRGKLLLRRGRTVVGVHKPGDARRDSFIIHPEFIHIKDDIAPDRGYSDPGAIAGITVGAVKGKTEEVEAIVLPPERR